MIIPVKFAPEPLNDVAVKIPVTTAPVFVVANLVELSYLKETAPVSYTHLTLPTILLV